MAPGRATGAHRVRPHVRPVLGRAFVAEENEPGKNKVVVLGHSLWRERFGADPGVVGQTIQLNREPHTVIAVAPAGFSYPEGAELWTPMEYDARFCSNSRGAWYLEVIGRLKAGAAGVDLQGRSSARRLLRRAVGTCRPTAGRARDRSRDGLAPERSALQPLPIRRASFGLRYCERHSLMSFWSSSRSSDASSYAANSPKLNAL